MALHKDQFLAKDQNGSHVRKHKWRLEATTIQSSRKFVSKDPSLVKGEEIQETEQFFAEDQREIQENSIGIWKL